MGQTQGQEEGVKMMEEHTRNKLSVKFAASITLSTHSPGPNVSVQQGVGVIVGLAVTVGLKDGETVGIIPEIHTGAISLQTLVYVASAL